MTSSTHKGHTHADRAYLETRSKLPCVAADWTGGSDRMLAVVLLVFGVALVAIAFSWVI